jgi:hypothetical protein
MESDAGMESIREFRSVEEFFPSRGDDDGAEGSIGRLDAVPEDVEDHAKTVQSHRGITCTLPIPVYYFV